MFNLREVRNELSNIDNFDLDCIFMSKEYELKKVLIEKELKKDLIKNLSNRFLYITKEKKMSEYDPTVKVDEFIDSISVTEVSTLNNIKQDFEDISTIEQIESFEDIENSKAYIIILKNKANDRKILFFKKSFSSIYLKSKAKVLFKEGRLKKIDSEILSLDDKFDCVMYQDEMAVFIQLYFEQIFDYKDEYTRKANRNISKIKNLNIIGNIEDIEEESEKITIKKKLAKLKEENINWFKERVNNDFETIKDIIDKAGLDMEIHNGKIISNDTSELIHLIQDDYLKSDLSGDNYVSERKTKI